jgi:alpha-L-fucosidase
MSEAIKTIEPLHAGAVEIEKAVKEYYPESDPLVLKKLEEWQNLKFGLMMHWAPSSQWGIVESWSLCSEDEDWCKRSIENYTEYKKRYEDLKKTFNPVKFNPAKWAEAAEEAGMKYVVFTTKHHDGFCMYDSKFTDYKITEDECPFHSNPKADISNEIFSEFRKKNFWIGAYFSKPDWHSDYFWWQRFATPDRNANYDINKYPERWQKFVEFTHNQIDELMTGYGKIDILWFDGCWVRSYTEKEIEEERKTAGSNICRIQNQYINMPLIAENARKKQPGIIVVDRAVPGPYQNYLTPENQIPENVLPYPWETCMPITPSWSYEPGLQYKPARKLIHLLIEIVSKGGNFLLNIAPTAEGDYEEEAYDSLKEIGDWMKVNSEAIYHSRPFQPYKEGKVCFTQIKDGTTYAIYLADENELSLPTKIIFDKYSPERNAEIILLGAKANIQWQKKGEGCEFEIPETVRSNPPSKYAWTFKISRKILLFYYLCGLCVFS